MLIPNNFFPWWFGVVFLFIFLLLLGLFVYGGLYIGGRIFKKKISRKNYYISFILLFVFVVFYFWFTASLTIK
jgi:ABC-type Na+ efflux pump permease subunit